MKGQTSTSALKRFMNKDNTVGHVFAFPFIFGFVCFSLIPVCISFYYAFTNYSLGSKTAAFIGFKNFLRLFQDEVFLKSLAITLKYVLISVPLKLTFALLVAYLLTRPSRMVTFYRSLYYLPSLVGGSVAVALVWKQLFARKGLFNSVLANMDMSTMLVTMMLPTQVIMIPQYLIYYRLGLVPGYVPLILPYFCGQAFFIYQMMQFMQGIPKDLDEAATIDGCSKYQIYSRIILPLMKPSIVTTVIIQFYWKWDDYMGPLLYLSRPQSYTVSIAIKLFADSASTTDYGAMFAMSTLSLIPVFLIFLFFNRYLVQGIGTSGLKG